MERITSCTQCGGPIWGEIGPEFLWEMCPECKLYFRLIGRNGQSMEEVWRKLSSLPGFHRVDPENPLDAPAPGGG